MIQLSVTQMLIVVGFFAGTCLNLIIFIYKNQSKRIDNIEEVQKICPINRIYTIIETVKKDVEWIKESIKKKV